MERHVFTERFIHTCSHTYTHTHTHKQDFFSPMKTVSSFPREFSLPGPAHAFTWTLVPPEAGSHHPLTGGSDEDLEGHDTVLVPPSFLSQPRQDLLGCLAGLLVAHSPVPQEVTLGGFFQSWWLRWAL